MAGMPQDALPHITEPNLQWIAHSLVLHNPDMNVLRSKEQGHYPPLAELLEIQMQKYEAAGQLLLPDLGVWGNKSVAIFSDYSGEASGKYYTYSFLICAMDALGYFRQEMKLLRQKYSLGDKEFAYKDLRMGSMRKALPEYLALLDKYVPGLLLTVVIDKQLVSVMGLPRGKRRKIWSRF